MEKGLLDILCNPSSDSDSSVKKDSLPFTMITTKTYLNPSEDPEYQEFKKLKQQQAVACGFDPSENRIISPETFRFIPDLRKTEKEVTSVTDRSSAGSLGKAIQDDFKSGSLLERLLRYEGQIERSLYRALTELQKFQFIRQRNDVLNVDDLSLPQGEASLLHNNNAVNVDDLSLPKGEASAFHNIQRSPSVPLGDIGRVGHAHAASVDEASLLHNEKPNEPISVGANPRVCPVAQPPSAVFNVAEASRFGDSPCHPRDLSLPTGDLSAIALATAEGGDPDFSLGSLSRPSETKTEGLSSMVPKPNEPIGLDVAQPPSAVFNEVEASVLHNEKPN
jgi:hypothetical protein